MAYLVTVVPTNWGPHAAYALTDTITLKSAGNRPIPNYPMVGATANFDTLYFISASRELMELTEQLRTWVVFHAFIFDFPKLCHFFEQEILNNPTLAHSIEELRQKPEANIRAFDFDNIAEAMYFPHKPPFQISYQELFKQYQSFSEDEQWLLRSFLYHVETQDTYSITHNLFEATRKYWQITSYVVLLESIIDHAPNCPGSAKSCSKCKRELQPHRQRSERGWRDEVLLKLIGNEEVKNQYMQAVNAAYEIRNRTAHAGMMPSPLYPETSATEAYTIDRAISEREKDMFALDTLVDLVRRVLRYLLLDRFYDLKTFPPLPESQVTTILKWIAPTND